MKKWLAMLALCLSGSYIHAQSEESFKTEIAHNQLMVELSAARKGSEVWQVCVTAKIKGSLKLKDAPQCSLLNTWNKDVFKTVIENQFLALFDSTEEKTSFWGDDANKQPISEQIALAFEKITFKKTYQPFTLPSDLHPGLSGAEIRQFEKIKNRLDSVQNAAKLVRKATKRTFQKSTDDGKTVSAAIFDETPVMAFLTPPADLNKKLDQVYLTTLLNKLKDEKAILKQGINNLHSNRKYLVNIVGDANVVSSFKNVSKTQFNAGFGVVAAKPGRTEFLGILTVAQIDDTIASSNQYDFGQCILVPGVRRFSLLTSFRQYAIMANSASPFLRKIGVGFNFNATPYRWYDTVAKAPSVKAIPFAADLLLPFTWLHEVDESKDVAISTDLGWTFRYIGGDVDKAARQSYLGNSKRFYNGPIIGLNIKYNALRAQFHCPFIGASQRVPGLTHGQVYASIGIVGNIFKDIGQVLKREGLNAATQ